MNKNRLLGVDAAALHLCIPPPRRRFLVIFFYILTGFCSQMSIHNINVVRTSCKFYGLGFLVLRGGRTNFRRYATGTDWWAPTIDTKSLRVVKIVHIKNDTRTTEPKSKRAVFPVNIFTRYKNERFRTDKYNYSDEIKIVLFK